MGCRRRICKGTVQTSSARFSLRPQALIGNCLLLVIHIVPRSRGNPTVLNKRPMCHRHDFFEELLHCFSSDPDFTLGVWRVA